jgi:Na+-transporting methylmalonyl-CoA/oxaloacetate decarboxylase gamma subunit
MRIALITLALALAGVVSLVRAQVRSDAPTDEKAQKTNKNAQQFMHEGMVAAALEAYKKADKQDSGHRRGCQ